MKMRKQHAKAKCKNAITGCDAIGLRVFVNAIANLKILSKPRFEPNVNFALFLFPKSLQLSKRVLQNSEENGIGRK
jgi:hypothetical protein